LPDTVIHFSFNLPLIFTSIPVTGLHILPFLYLGSQFLSTKLTTAQNATTSNGQMKFMMYGMPAIFFFILYEGPAGLFVYWIFQNLLQIVQQRMVTNHLAKIKAQRAIDEPRNIIKPGQAGKSGTIIKGKFDNPQGKGKGPKGSGPKKTK